MERIPAKGDICRTCKYWNINLTIPLCLCQLMTEPEDSQSCLSYEPTIPDDLSRPVWPPIEPQKENNYTKED